MGNGSGSGGRCGSAIFLKSSEKPFILPDCGYHVSRLYEASSRTVSSRQHLNPVASLESARPQEPLHNLPISFRSQTYSNRTRYRASSVLADSTSLFYGLYLTTEAEWQNIDAEVEETM